LLGYLPGTETPCTRDNLKTVVLRTYHDGQNQAIAEDGLGKFFQLLLVEGLAWVGGGFEKLVYRDVLEFAAVLHDALLWAVGGCGCEAHTLPCIRSVGGELGLGVWRVSPLERLKKALETQVVVPLPCQSLVLHMHIGKVDVVTVVDVSAPLLYARRVVPVIEGVQV
jgi:hypothetical protein